MQPLIGNAGMLLVATTAPVWVLIIPMLMLGFSFGLSLGFVDGAALAAVPPHSSGAAAGVLSSCASAPKRPSSRSTP
jgi:hypothetical protein